MFPGSASCLVCPLVSLFLFSHRCVRGLKAISQSCYVDCSHLLSSGLGGQSAEQRRSEPEALCSPNKQDVNVLGPSLGFKVTVLCVILGLGRHFLDRKLVLLFSLFFSLKLWGGKAALLKDENRHRGIQNF